MWIMILRNYDIQALYQGRMGRMKNHQCCTGITLRGNRLLHKVLHELRVNLHMMQLELQE
jgi:hypothetical protein